MVEGSVLNLKQGQIFGFIEGQTHSTTSMSR
jgi:hypothetical protein